MAGDERARASVAMVPSWFYPDLFFALENSVRLFFETSEPFKQCKLQAPNTWSLNCYSSLKWIDQGAHLTLLIKLNYLWNVPLKYTEILSNIIWKLVYTYQTKRTEYLVYVNSDQKLVREKSFKLC